MKRIVVVVLLLVFLAGMAFGQEEKKPTAAVSFELFGSIIAPMGVGAEFFVGQRLGLGAELRFLFLGYGGNFVGTVEPGGAVRFYFGDLDSSMFLMGGVSYVTAFAIGEGSGVSSIGILKPKVAVGYNALFGKGNKTRFAIELGAVYMQPIVEGDVIDISNVVPILPHFLIMFGRVF
jgi:hypothetical protein